MSSSSDADGDAVRPRALHAPRLAAPVVAGAALAGASLRVSRRAAARSTRLSGRAALGSVRLSGRAVRTAARLPAHAATAPRVLQEVARVAAGIVEPPGVVLLPVPAGTDPTAVDARHRAATAVAGAPGVAAVRELADTGRLGVLLTDDADPVSTRKTARAALADTDVRVAAGHSAAHARHPADAGPLLVHALALAADVVGTGVGMATALARVTPLPLPPVAARAAVANDPRLRKAAERALGPLAAEAALAVAGAAAEGLAQGPAPVAVDALHRTTRIAELVAARSAWSRRAPDLLRAQPADVDRPAGGTTTRPVPLPDGTVDCYVARASAAAAAAAAATLTATGRPQRSAEVYLAGMPRSATLGREAFAAQLGRTLAARGAVVLDDDCLRRLDRIDTVVVDLRAFDDGAAAEVESLRAMPRGRLRLLTTGGDRGARLLDADGSVAGGTRLAREVRRLQREGAAVLLVGGSAAADALRAADVGVELPVPAGTGPAWTSDVLAASAADAVTLVAACAAARRAGRRAVALALAGSGLATASALLPVRGGLPRRGSYLSAAAATAALGAGTWSALTVDRDLPRVRLPQPPWHALAPEAVLTRLRSRPEGLPESEAAERYTEMHPAERRRDTLERALRPFLEEAANPLTPVLALGAGLSALSGSMTDSAVVASLIGINSVVGGVQRRRTERAIAELVESTSRPVTVVRDGVEHLLDPSALVPGDVVRYRAGDVVAGDCRLLQGEQVEVDESSLTGESQAVAKTTRACAADAVSDRSCMLYSGTTLVSGRGLAVVVATGPDTEVGHGMALAEGAAPPRGVERRLAELSRRTAPLAAGAAVLVTGAGLLQRWPARQVLESAVGLAVASVPEGLPVIAHVAQAASARRLAEHSALVRNPRAIEALGRVDTLCFDKTGTLTKGKVRLRAVLEPDGTGEGTGLQEPSRRQADVLVTALRTAPSRDDGSRNETDDALAAAARRAALEPDEGWQCTAELPFEAGRGFAAMLGMQGDAPLLAVKGAPESVLERCTAVRLSGRRRRLDEARRSAVVAEVERLAAEGSRVLAVACRRAEPGTEQLTADDVRGLELRGLLAFAEEVRPSAARAMHDLRRAGVRVVMLTGDHPATAEAVASELDIVADGQVMIGEELDALDDDELAAVLPEVTVFARVTPAHKVRIVRGLQAAGSVVGVTGDGANDAPSMRLADCGIAVGKRSAPAAREAADIVVTSNRVETVTAALVEGRAMWGSVREGLAILVGGNLGEIGYTVIGSLLARGPVLNTRQLLLVNLLTDLAPAVAVSMRPPSRVHRDNVLCEGPDASLGDRLDQTLAVRAAATGAAAITAYTLGRFTGTPARARTVGLVALVGAQLGQTLVAAQGDRAVAATGLLSLAALTAAVQTPGVSTFFGSRPIGPAGWATALGAAGMATAGSVLADHWLSAHDSARPAGEKATAVQDQRVRGTRRRTGHEPAAPPEAGDDAPRPPSSDPAFAAPTRRGPLLVR